MRSKLCGGCFAGLAFVFSLVAARDGPAQQTNAASCAEGGFSVLIEREHRCVTSLVTFRDCPECPELVALPGGTFEMGSPDTETGRANDEGPRHTVKIAAPFAVAKFETTFSEWDACVDSGGCLHRPRDSFGRGRRPVINVSWDDITKEFLPWLSRKTGQTYRLLTEAEWEYAARAESTSAFSSGPTITTADANFDGTSTYAGSPPGAYRKQTLEVGSFAANRFGLHDMHGNVWEWVQDCYVGSYVTARPNGSVEGEIPGCQRVMRGGSWIDSPRVLRVASRGHVPAGTRFIYRGFRVARGM